MSGEESWLWEPEQLQQPDAMASVVYHGKDMELACGISPFAAVFTTLGARVSKTFYLCNLPAHLWSDPRLRIIWELIPERRVIDIIRHQYASWIALIVGLPAKRSRISLWGITARDPKFPGKSLCDMFLSRPGEYPP